MSPPLIERPSPNFDARTSQIALVVLHYTGMQDANAALRRLTDPAPTAGDYPGPWQQPGADPAAPLPRVSAHYVVDEGGAIFRIVPEEQRAWHAGVSSWGGAGDVNARAIGIEIVNGGHDFGLPDFAPVQIEALIALVADILARRGLTASAVVGHSDIAPARKLDPGEKFPWKRLADAGVALWPKSAAPIAAERARAALTRFGYDPQVPDEVMVAAFQRRFRPQRIDGVLDEETRALIAGLH